MSAPRPLLNPFAVSILIASARFPGAWSAQLEKEVGALERRQVPYATMFLEIKRLEREGLLRGEWEGRTAVCGRRKRFSTLSEHGRFALRVALLRARSQVTELEAVVDAFQTEAAHD